MNSIPCQLFRFLGTDVERFGLECYGDFVDNIHSNSISKYVLFATIENRSQAEAIVAMFNCDCDTHFPSCGVSIGPAKLGSLYYLAIGVDDCHLDNLNSLRNLVAADWTISPDKIKEARALTVSAVKAAKA